MSYTAPAGNAVSFEFDGNPYTAPAGDGVQFVSLVLSCSGGIAVSGSANVNSGTAAPCSGRVVVGGAATLNAGASLAAFGRVGLSGAVAARVDAMVVSRGALLVSGTAYLSLGNALSVRGVVGFKGAVRVDIGRTLALSGRVWLNNGAADIRHGVALSGASPARVTGSASFTSLHGFSLTSHGAVVLAGGAALEVKRDAPLPSLFVRSTRSYTEVIVHALNH